VTVIAGFPSGGIGCTLGAVTSVTDGKDAMVPGFAASEIDTSKPHPARMYDAYLGGKDNYAVDRAAVRQILRTWPEVRDMARANRAFLQRAVRFLAGEAGIRQFIDIGPGLPSPDSTHEIAQANALDCRVVYVDNDPVVLLHAQARLAGSATGATGYVDADLRDPAEILRAAASLVDLSQPVAVLLFGILHFIQDDEGPYQIADVLMDAMPPGSYLAVSHFAKDLYRDQMARFARVLNENLSVGIVPRDKAEVARFFRRLDLAEPGVVQVPKWRPRNEAESGAAAAVWGGVGRKPDRAHSVRGVIPRSNGILDNRHSIAARLSLNPRRRPCMQTRATGARRVLGDHHGDEQDQADVLQRPHVAHAAAAARNAGGLAGPHGRAAGAWRGDALLPQARSRRAP
jgi:S-adenosyl methyltransferase